jgi:ferredoxin-type protein NapF
MQRRELFSSLANSFNKNKQESKRIRPPYFKDLDSFDKGCLECDGICATFCEENIIVIDEDKKPYLDFSKGGCTYCDECAKNCPKEVLEIQNKSLIEAKFEIDILECISWHNTMCFSCKDPCLDDAIEFLALFRPSIVEDKCTNCGFCVKICPSNAIKVIPKE